MKTCVCELICELLELRMFFYLLQSRQLTHKRNKKAKMSRKYSNMSGTGRAAERGQVPRDPAIFWGTPGF